MGDAYPIGPKNWPEWKRKALSQMTFGAFDRAAIIHDIDWGKNTDKLFIEGNKTFKRNLKTAWQAQDSFFKRQYLRGMSHVFYFAVSKFGRPNYDGDEFKIKFMRLAKTLFEKERAEKEKALAEFSKFRSEIYDEVKGLHEIIGELRDIINEEKRQPKALEIIKTERLG